MTLKKIIKELLGKACVTFSVIMLIYIIIAAIVNVSDDKLLLDAGRVVLFFVFSCLMSCAGLLLRAERLGGGARLILHYLITLFGFYTCFVLSLNLKASGLVVGFTLFTALYFAVMGIRRALLNAYRKNAEAAESYQKQYGKTKK